MLGLIYWMDLSIFLEPFLFVNYIFYIKTENGRDVGVTMKLTGTIPYSHPHFHPRNGLTKLSINGIRCSVLVASAALWSPERLLLYFLIRLGSVASSG